ncbi:MAG TPA: winged helix-turn-helix domain-containing protein [Candidatus Saccharimonadales bacterium]|nr:winged helix-turn-helix domain-containing protein [Candidatus Saccharimonadales bacterium]
MLDLFITSKTRRKIITVFTKYPDFQIHVRGLAQRIKEDPGNVQRELQKLQRIGFVTATKEGNTKVYCANDKFVLYRELQSMVLKSQAKRR